MLTRQLGAAGPRLSALGLGLMGMSDFYGPADRRESLATIDAALAAGINWFDSGDFYGMGHNELLLSEALAHRRRENVFIALKFGVLRGPDGGFAGVDGRPAAIRNFLAYSLRRLGTDYVDLYQPARLDPAVPIEDTVGAIKDLITAGYVRYVGLSEVGAATLRRAHAVHPIAALQIEYSLLSRGIEADILPAARALGVAISAYGVLSRGLLGGHWTAARGAGNLVDFRAHMPRFTGANLERNLGLVQTLQQVAEAADTTAARLAIAWVLSRGEDILPLIGARSRAQLAQALPATALELSPEMLAQIEQAVPAGAVSGARYPAPQLALLDSERAAGSAT